MLVIGRVVEVVGGSGSLVVVTTTSEVVVGAVTVVTVSPRQRWLTQARPAQQSPGAASQYA
jgi:hypothetical protein